MRSGSTGRAFGHVYVMSNPSMPGVVKIGRTTRPVAARARELSSSTGVATPYRVEATVTSPDASAVEAAVHAALAHRRVNARREFFAVTVDEALAEMRRASTPGAVRRWRARRSGVRRRRSAGIPWLLELSIGAAAACWLVWPDRVGEALRHGARLLSLPW